MAENIKEQIEDKIIDCINSESGGRLIIFKPEKNNFGADLAVVRRGKYKEKEMFFLINSLIIPAKTDKFIKDFTQENFKTDKSYYLIFAYFDEVKQKVSEHIWLIPSLQFRDKADVIKSSDGKKLLRFEGALDSKNKYAKFILKTEELGKLILDAFEKKGEFDFKETDFEEKKSVNLERLKEFLVEHLN